MKIAKNLAAAFLLLTAFVSCGVPNDGTYNITICETTDIHGAYFDSTYDGRAARTSMANVSTFLKELRAEDPGIVLIDNGDNLQGDNAAYYYNYVAVDQPHVFSKIAESFGYDAIVMGNHDFETGHPVYDRLKASSKIPYLAANAVYEDGGEPYFEPYTIVKRGGLKIAIIGMTNANIKSWLGEDLWKGIDFQMISDVAQGWIDKVTAECHPHLVILSVHSGTRPFGDDEPQPDIESEALYLAETLEGVDVVFCGHDHRPFETIVDKGDGRSVALLNAGSRASKVARCDVKIDIEEGKVVSKSFDNNLVDMTSYAPDEDFEKKFRPEFEEVKAFANKEIGFITEDISFEDCLEGPSAYINLIHTVQLESTGADVSFTAPLSDRGTVKAGKVTYQNLSELYRYENTLYVTTMTGRQIRDFLEFAYDLWVCRKGPAYNYDSADGINYTVSKSAPYGKRVRISSMSDGSAFDEDATYKVAINSYRANGGGGHIREGVGIDPSSLEILTRYSDIKTLIGDYISSHKTITPQIPANWKFTE